MNHEFTCTIHNLAFGFDTLPEPYKIGFVPGCPCCAYDRIDQIRTKCEETMEHRDLLLKAINLAATLQPTPRRGESL